MITLQLNSRPARRALSSEVRAQPRTPARSRRERSSFGWVVAGIIGLSLFGLAWVGQSAAATQVGYQIGALKTRQQQLLAEQQRIVYRISVASSAGRLDVDATRLGLVRSGRWVYLPTAASPVALLRSSSGEGDAGAHSFFSALAFALGRPADAEARGR